MSRVDPRSIAYLGLAPGRVTALAVATLGFLPLLSAEVPYQPSAGPAYELEQQHAVLVRLAAVEADDLAGERPNRRPSPAISLEHGTQPARHSRDEPIRCLDLGREPGSRPQVRDLARAGWAFLRDTRQDGAAREAERVTVARGTPPRHRAAHGLGNRHVEIGGNGGHAESPAR